MKRERLTKGALVLGLPMALSVAERADATPKSGVGLPSVNLIDAWDRSTPAKNFAGTATIVFYEDKDTGKTTEALKADLKKRSNPDGSGLALTVVPVADVTGYDYWPARGFVKDAVKKESKKQKTTIFVDFDGAAAKAFDAKHGEATVVVYGKDGKVIASHGGPFSESDRKAFVEIVVAAAQG